MGRAGVAGSTSISATPASPARTMTTAVATPADTAAAATAVYNLGNGLEYGRDSCDNCGNSPHTRVPAEARRIKIGVRVVGTVFVTVEHLRNGGVEFGIVGDESPGGDLVLASTDGSEPGGWIGRVVEERPRVRGWRCACRWSHGVAVGVVIVVGGAKGLCSEVEFGGAVRDF